MFSKAILVFVNFGPNLFFKMHARALSFLMQKREKRFGPKLTNAKIALLNMSNGQICLG